MKINWFSNAPWASTGYGNQTRLFVPRLRDMGHEMSITAFYGLQGGTLNVDGIPIFPNGKHPYGQDIIGSHAQNLRADIIISLFDVWAIVDNNIPKGLGWYPWFPVDHEPIPPAVSAKVRRSDKGITMSRFGLRMAQQVGLDTYYVPHGVDTKIFKPTDREAARKFVDWPDGKFVVGMVAANKGFPPRKAFYQQILAFAALRKKHDDVMLYLHTDDGTHGGDGVDLIEYCQVLGLTVGHSKGKGGNYDVLVCDQYTYLIGHSDEYMKAAYNAMDVLLMVSMGEGFGIPLIEAQACGCPVITGEWTSMDELCLSGWKVKKKDADPFFTPQGSFQFVPRPDIVAEKLFEAYEMRGSLEYRERARKAAQKYDADHIAEKYWKPVLEDIAAKRGL